MSFADEIVRLGQQIVDERSAAHDLWTWLPSYQLAKKHHGDYASTVCPSVKDVLHEASMFIAHKQGAVELTPAELEWFERCPCGEDHTPVERSAAP